jgi:hypothetical protein
MQIAIVNRVTRSQDERATRIAMTAPEAQEAVAA